MSYRIYTTDAIILGSTGTGEANRFYRIYTRELGMVFATAQGVREMKSKLRYALQDFSYSEVSLVRGKGAWRITNALFISNPYLDLMEERSKRAVFLNVLALLRRLVKGEEQDERLFSVLEGFVETLKSAETREAIALVEILAVLRILENQGVREHHGSLDVLVKSDVWGEEAMQGLAQERSRALKHINTSLKTLQL